MNGLGRCKGGFGGAELSVGRTRQFYIFEREWLNGLGAKAMLHLAAYGFAAIGQRKSRNHRFLAAFLFLFSFRCWKEKRPPEAPHL